MKIVGCDCKQIGAGRGKLNRSRTGQLILLLTSLPQHSGRSGKLDRSHPPPRA